MKEYLDVLKLVHIYGEPVKDRTGVGTRSYFSPPEMVFDLTKGFPLVTTKKLFTKGIVAELLWMLSGSTNIKPLVEQNVHIWDEWANERGELGPVYGAQWRHWYDNDGNRVRYIDQISELIKGLKENPTSRRHIVSAWNVGELDQMALPPCHCFFQCYVRLGMYLDLKLYQRSADMFLGVPFNIASYALLTHMLAAQTGLTAGRFIHTLGDAHIYNNHREQVGDQLFRTPFEPPTLWLNSEVTSIFDYTVDDIQFLRYQSHPAIKGDVAV